MITSGPALSLRSRVNAALVVAERITGKPVQTEPPALDGQEFMSWAMPVVEGVLQSFRPVPGYDREDLVQEALVGIVHACKTYDPKEGRFSSWAARHAIQRVLDVVRWSDRHKDELSADSLDGDDEDKAGGERLSALADPTQDPHESAVASPRKTLAWAIAAEAARRGPDAEGALDAITSRATSDALMSGEIRKELAPVITKAVQQSKVNLRTAFDMLNGANAEASEVLRSAIAAGLKAAIMGNSLRRAEA